MVSSEVRGPHPESKSRHDQSEFTRASTTTAPQSSSKRRRSSNTPTSTFSAGGNGTATRDVYDTILQNSIGETSAASSADVLSSWLTKIEWISSDLASSAPRSTEDIQNEIQTLSRQLLQVKRRMGPAAERVTEARNGNLQQQHYSHRSTVHQEFDQARRACNPFEVLGEGRDRGLNNHLFMNRSAIKLANLDALLGFSLTSTNARDTGGGNKDDDSAFVFADLCGAPGGFSEYILWRCHSFGVTACLGYGMSLVGTNEQGNGLTWKLQDETYTDYHGMYSQYRICTGVDGSGDIYQWQNVQALLQMIQNDTKSDNRQLGRANLVLADGGFDDQRDSDNQEEVAQKLVVCEVAAALSLLRPGGSLVLKIFGAQTVVVRAVLRHLFFAFDHLLLVKPIASRPASAERYLVCTGFRGNPNGWDGSRWSNQMFLGLHCHVSSFPAVIPHYQHALPVLDLYLDEFDRDMLNLNLKACFSILTYLENECQRFVASPQAATWADQMDEDDDDSMTGIDDESPRVYIAPYKYAWRLA